MEIAGKLSELRIDEPTTERRHRQFMSDRTSELFFLSLVTQHDAVLSSPITDMSNVIRASAERCDGCSALVLEPLNASAIELVLIATTTLHDQRCIIDLV